MRQIALVSITNGNDIDVLAYPHHCTFPTWVPALVPSWVWDCPCLTQLMSQDNSSSYMTVVNVVDCCRLMAQAAHGPERMRSQKHQTYTGRPSCLVTRNICKVFLNATMTACKWLWDRRQRCSLRQKEQQRPPNLPLCYGTVLDFGEQ